MRLRTACRILLDVLECDGEDAALGMPICCFYSIRAARRRMQERDEFAVDERLSRDVAVLLRAEEKYRDS